MVVVVFICLASVMEHMREMALTWHLWLKSMGKGTCVVVQPHFIRNPNVTNGFINNKILIDTLTNFIQEDPTHQQKRFSVTWQPEMVLINALLLTCIVLMNCFMIYQTLIKPLVTSYRLICLIRIWCCFY